MKPENKTIAEFVKIHGLTGSAETVAYDAGKDGDTWDQSARHFVVTLRRGRKSMRVRFHQGSAHTVDPTAADVLDCLASDASGYDNARGFIDWCGEYGYDTDSRKDEKIFNTVKAQSEKLRAFLGDATYEALLWNTERA